VALTLSRWATLAGLGCLVLAIAYLPPQPLERLGTPEHIGTPEGKRHQLISRAQNHTRQLLLEVQFRDSLRRALSAVRPGAPAVTVAVAGPIPESSRRELNVAMAHLWESLDPVPQARVAILVNANVQGLQRSYVLPGILDGRTCVASISLDWSVQWLRKPTSNESGTNLRPWLRDAIAPCLYYAVFGRPGPAIEAWLTERAFRPAYGADWNAPPTTLVPRDDQERGVYNYLVSQASFDALACADGDLPRCRQAMLGPARDEFRSQRIAGLIRRDFWSLGFPGEDRYFPALVHEMGRERFARFWRSSAPVDTAFLAAFGQPMEAWTARWTGDFASDVPPFGPAPRPQAVLYSLALAAIAVAAVTGLVTRRQVG
jgi:hypothetical protein